MQTQPDFQDLMALVGHLLLRWGVLEKNLAGRPTPPELAEVRQMRNAICHGLEGATADPSSPTPPQIRCRLANGSTMAFTAEDLKAAIASLERIGPRYL